MATLAGTQLQHAATAFASRDLGLAHGLDREDDAIDKLNREVFETTLELEAAAERRELGLRHVLLARSLERIGDNAVDIAEHAAFLVTAELREFTDASRAKPKADRPLRPTPEPPDEGDGSARLSRFSHELLHSPLSARSRRSGEQRPALRATPLAPGTLLQCVANSARRSTGGWLN
jgi:hypothetical protein